MKLECTFRYLIIGIIAVVSIVVVKGQNSPSIEVEVSTQKVLIGGKAYYLHSVKKGQTLYSIAKAYGCTVNDVLQENPGLTEELKVDQVIKLPVKEKAPVSIDAGKEVMHTVMQGQTLFSIARMYGVSVQDIRLTNQLTSDTLRVSQQLVIPVTKRTEATTVVAGTAPSATGQYRLHQVQAGETLYSLAKKYGTTVEKILEINPDQCDGLKLGAEIKIPAGDVAIQPLVLNCDTINFQLKGKSISIALLLPLFADNNEKLENTEEENRQELLQSQKGVENFPPIVMNFIEFYQGVLLAVEDLKKEGLNIELNVFDTGKGKEKISSIVSQPAFQRSQLIIGPVFSEQIPIIATYARQNRIPVVLPVTTADSLVQQTNGLYQVFSGQKGEIDQLIKAISTDSVRNILVVYNGKDNPQFNQQIHNQLIPLTSNASKKLKEFYVYNYDFKDLLANLDTSRNHVICFSVDEVFVASLLGQLEKKLLYFPIRTYGMSEWLAFNSVDLHYFYDQQLTCFSNFYVDYDHEKVLRFLKKYRLRFGTEPVRNSKFGYNFCMLGYDLVQYFAAAVACMGNNFAAYSCVPYTAINVKLQFTPAIPGGGYFNHAFYRLQFRQDYTFSVE